MEEALPLRHQYHLRYHSKMPYIPETEWSEIMMNNKSTSTERILDMYWRSGYILSVSQFKLFVKIKGFGTVRKLLNSSYREFLTPDYAYALLADHHERVFKIMPIEFPNLELCWEYSMRNSDCTNAEHFLISNPELLHRKPSEDFITICVHIDDPTYIIDMYLKTHDFPLSVLNWACYMLTDGNRKFDVLYDCLKKLCSRGAMIHGSGWRCLADRSFGYTPTEMDAIIKLSGLPELKYMEHSGLTFIIGHGNHGSLIKDFPIICLQPRHSDQFEVARIIQKSFKISTKSVN